MNLSFKATQFIIEAIEYQFQAYQERLSERWRFVPGCDRRFYGVEKRT